MRDLCLRVCRECRKPLKTRVNSKYQSKGSTYILHLLAFVEIRLFNVFFWERKAVFGKLMKNVRDAGVSQKRGGNAGSGPPSPLPEPARKLTQVALKQTAAWKQAKRVARTMLCSKLGVILPRMMMMTI